MVSDDFLSLSDYGTLYRHDRYLRRGGGVCLYCKGSLFCKEVTTSAPPPSCTECIWIALPTLKIVFVAIYVPSNLTVVQYSEIIEFIVNEGDNAMASMCDYRLIIAGDLNQLPTNILEGTLGLEQMVGSPTRRSSILDKLLVDSRLLEHYHLPIVGPNIGNADHLTVFLRPVIESATTSKITKVYDLRESHLVAFTKALKTLRWEDFYRSDDSLQTKCDVFYKMVEDALSVIPIHYVELMARDKPWMTPVLKHLINCRYEAYRNRRMNEYEHYKGKVKKEIERAKSMWMKSLKNSKGKIWQAVRTTTSGSSRV